MLLTNDGSRLSAHPAILLLRCPNLRPLLAQNRFSLSGKPVWEAPSISVDFGAREVSALLTFLEEGETSFQNKEMFQGMVDLARALGVNIKDGDTIRCNGDESMISILDLNRTEELVSRHVDTRRCGGETDLSSMLLVDEGYPEDLELDEKLISLPKPRQSGLRKKQQSMEPLLYPKSCGLTEYSDSRSFKCDNCPKLFKSKSKLKFHAMCHPSLSCNSCGQGFSFSSLLKRHMAICKAAREDVDNLNKEKSTEEKEEENQ